MYSLLSKKKIKPWLLINDFDVQKSKKKTKIGI